MRDEDSNKQKNPPNVCVEEINKKKSKEKGEEALGVEESEKKKRGIIRNINPSVWARETGRSRSPGPCTKPVCTYYAAPLSRFPIYTVSNSLDPNPVNKRLRGEDEVTIRLPPVYCRKISHPR